MTSRVGDQASHPALGGASKVPAVITGVFWTAKLCSTALGEATSDWLVHDLGDIAAVLLGAVAFGLVLGAQLTSRRYLPWLYWSCVTMVAVFGTMVADVVHIGLGIPYLVSTTALAVILAAVFWLWSRFERTISIHSITTPRRELFYWAAVITTFALGTAAGDLLATTFGLGYLTSTLVFIILFAIPALAYGSGRMEATLAFWFAYVLTRPIGASVADFMVKPPSASGMGWAYGPVILGLGAALLVTVGIQQHRWQAARRRHVGHRHPA
jgi:uncharacterized membrane-anchored protein